MRILFVCLGNICRSPMAETIFRSIVNEKGLDDNFVIDSAGLHAYHEGEMADSRMRAHASKRGYNITHHSRPVVKNDFDNFDLIIGMDYQNMRGLESRMPTGFPQNKLQRMTNYCTKYIEADEVPDPYYGGAEGFEYVIDLLEDACNGLLATIEEQMNKG